MLGLWASDFVFSAGFENNETFKNAILSRLWQKVNFAFSHAKYSPQTPSAREGALLLLTPKSQSRGLFVRNTDYRQRITEIHAKAWIYGYFASLNMTRNSRFSPEFLWILLRVALMTHFCYAKTATPQPPRRLCRLAMTKKFTQSLNFTDEVRFRYKFDKAKYLELNLWVA